VINSPRTPMDNDEQGEVETTLRMLHVAGPRAAPPAERQSRVRSHVHLHWHGSVRRRPVGPRRVAAWTGMLAAAAALVLIVSRLDDRSAPAPVPAGAAWVATISGPQAAAHRAMSGGSARPLSIDEAVVVGETIETDAGRVGLRFADGTSVRLDVSSRATLVGARAIELSSGAVYVDTGTGAHRLDIRTSLGTARDIGTQFEVRLFEGRLRLRVRTGAVELSDRSRSVTGHAGTEILFSATEAESRPLAPFGPEWQWTVELSPPIDIEGLPLATYLDRLAREQGWTVQYVDSTLARDAGGIILHGSVAGLAPADALDVAIGTSGLAYRLDNGRLVVSRETPR
jgi:ferric-dicitrate binding protein FerR (iron transport regulator)